MSMRIVCALFLLVSGAIPAFSAAEKLYLKDGSFQYVREYQRQGDRIRYYSTERSEWEEIPVELVDLAKTESESERHKASVDEQAKMISDEDKAVRAQQELVLKIPQDPGVYMLDDAGHLTIFKLAEVTVHTSKGRSILKLAAPRGLVNGKATVELNGDHAADVLKEPRPEFYLQLAKEERFGVIKLTPHHGVRVAERVTIVPIINENEEVVDEVPTFHQQLTDGGLYKIWPEKPLEAGEYAVLEFTPGKLEPRIWDFRINR